MYDRETVGLALYALEDGMTQREAAELCGVSRASVGFWTAGRVPHERGAGGIRVDGRARARDAGERAAHEAAMTENTLLKAVLDNLKSEGCAPATASRRRCAGLGERLCAETGLSLTRILAFLGISKSPREHRRARLGADRHAELARRGVRVSEKVVRRLMRGQGLTAARARPRSCTATGAATTAGRGESRYARPPAELATCRARAEAVTTPAPRASSAC